MRRTFSELRKDEKINLIVFITVRVIVLLLIMWAIADTIKAHTTGSTNTSEIRSRAIFVLTNCVIMLIASFLPSILEHTWKVEIPSVMEIVFIVFCFLCLVLGEIGNFYAKFKWWDSMLHASSGFLITALGFVVLNTLNKSDHIYTRMSPVSVCIFAFCFSVSIGAIWEIIEWTIDGSAGTNMQRFRYNYDSQVLFMGREALRDTMKDLILDTLGSLAVSIFGYIDLKNKKTFVPNLVLASTDEEVANIKVSGWHKRDKKRFLN
ncbi:MAG: hypothetical protein K6G28_03015 [Acholeplasmatales bacterium]|nr:hypothetical protein [Acholeplasmatales bacterium]